MISFLNLKAGFYIPFLKTLVSTSLRSLWPFQIDGTGIGDSLEKFRK